MQAVAPGVHDRNRTRCIIIRKEGSQTAIGGTILDSLSSFLRTMCIVIQSDPVVVYAADWFDFVHARLRAWHFAHSNARATIGYVALLVHAPAATVEQGRILISEWSVSGGVAHPTDEHKCGRHLVCRRDT